MRSGISRQYSNSQAGNQVTTVHTSLRSLGRLLQIRRLSTTWCEITLEGGGVELTLDLIATILRAPGVGDLTTERGRVLHIAIT